MTITVRMAVVTTVILFLSSFAPQILARAESIAYVRLVPGFTVLDTLGDQVTIACIIENAESLEGFDIIISWDATYLDYVAHTVTVPVEDYPSPVPPSPYGGVLHDPVVKLWDEVTTFPGTYHVTYGTLGSAFTGNGTVFVMTFRMMAHPQTFVDVNIHFESCDLVREHQSVECVCEDAVVRLLGWDVENHDLAVLQAYTSKNGCLPFPVVGQGRGTDVTVVVENQGGYHETFDIAVYANNTRVNTRQGLTLSPGNTDAFVVHLGTAGLVKGTWVVSAIVESTTDIETADNSLTAGTIFVSIEGDVDGDRDVDIFDMVRIAGVYGVSTPDLRYDPNCDIDDNGAINIFDVVIATGTYGLYW